MIDFRVYDRIRLYTHNRTETPTGHEVGHFDDWLLMALSAYLPRWSATRLDRVDDVQYVGSRLSPEPYVLNVVADFIYSPTPEEKNLVVFDHHDPSRPTDKCSAHLLMEELVRQGMLREVPSLMEEISLWDVVGPQAVTPENRPDPDRYLSILAAEPSEGFTRKEAEFILHMLDRSFSIRQFVNELFESETRLGENARRIHSEILDKREEALSEILSDAKLEVSPSGVRYIVFSRNPAGLLNEIFSRFGADIAIHPNERTEGAFSIVRDSNGRYATTPVAELVEVVSEKVVFVHPGGFLLVAYPPVVIK